MTCAKSVAKFVSIINPTTGYDKNCSVCTKNIRVAKTSIPCGYCRHLIHKKCADVKNWSVDSIESHLMTWECLTLCMLRAQFWAEQNFPLHAAGPDMGRSTCNILTLAVDRSDAKQAEKFCSMSLPVNLMLSVTKIYHGLQ